MNTSFIHLFVDSFKFDLLHLMCVKCLREKKIGTTSEVRAASEVGFFTCHLEQTTSLRLTKE